MSSVLPRILAGFLTVAIAASGCIQSDPPAAPAQGWSVDCGLGEHERNLGRAWLQDCLARASHTPGSKQEVWLAVNPTDPDNVILGAKDLDPALSRDCVWNGIYVTHDGGVSWKDVYISGKYEDRLPGNPYYGYACNTDPMGVFTADGTVHWLVEMYNLGGTDGSGPLGPDPGGRALILPGWKLVLAHSHDGGDTWPLEEVTTLEYGDGVAVLNDYSRITVNPKTGSVVTVINTFYPALGSFTLPVAGGVCSVLVYRGEGQPVQEIPVHPVVHTPGDNPGSAFCNGIAGAPKGTLTMSAVGSESAAPAASPPLWPMQTVWFAQSHDDGATWTALAKGFSTPPIEGRFAESAYRTGTNFELAYDTGNGSRAGTLYAIFAANYTFLDPNGLFGDSADIFVTSSKDNGATWSHESRVNAVQAGHQFMPNLAVAGDGSLHAFFMDKSYDTAAHRTAAGIDCPDHCFIDITYARSDDGGATWTNRRVTTAAWDGDLGLHQEGFPFIGDYIGVGAVGDTVWGGFPDASNGSQTVIAAAKVQVEP